MNSYHLWCYVGVKESSGCSLVTTLPSSGRWLERKTGILECKLMILIMGILRISLLISTNNIVLLMLPSCVCLVHQESELGRSNGSSTQDCNSYSTLLSLWRKHWRLDAMLRSESWLWGTSCRNALQSGSLCVWRWEPEQPGGFPLMTQSVFIPLHVGNGSRAGAKEARTNMHLFISQAQ